MSSIDERVVRMEFDNKQFESGVSTTMSTLEKLNDALKFRNAAIGFDDIQKASASLNFAPLNDSIWQVQQNFSLLGEFARNIFDRISNSVIDLGSNIVREMTVAPLQAGFSEYELMMDSVKTIMASAGEREGKSLDDVMGYLDELNTYADKTIYSFSDMTSSIGKFTNAGVDLDTAVKAIQGISNEAALAGANASQASHAMYNFAQALSGGYVKLIDWRSIETAQMATTEFREQLLETAVELGTVEKTADGMYQVLSKNGQGATMKGTISATQNFNDSLAYQWMTTEVLTTTLGKYADETTDIGQRAFAAATEVRTFSQLIDTVKETLGSGWTKSFQYVIGDLEESKELWTAVNNEITAILDPIAQAREEMLKFWHDNGGRATAIQAIADAWEGVKTVVSTISDTFTVVFGKMDGEKLVAITQAIGDIAGRFKEFATSYSFLTRIEKIFDVIFTIASKGIGLLKGVAVGLSPLVSIFADFGGVAFEVVYRVASFVQTLMNAEKPISAFKNNATYLKNTLRLVVSGIENLVKALLDFIGVHIEGNPVVEMFDKLAEFASSHFDFSFMDALVSVGKGLLAIFGSLGGVLSTALNGVLNFVGGGLGFVLDALSGFASGAEKASDGVQKLSDSFDAMGAIKVVIDSLGSIVSIAGSKIVNFVSWIGENLPKLFAFLGSQELHGIIVNFTSLMSGGLLLSLRNFVEALSSRVGVKKSGGLLDSIKELFGGITDKATDAINDLSEALSGFQDAIKGPALLEIAIAIGILAGSMALLASVDPDRMSNGIAGLAASMAILVVAFKLLEGGKLSNPRGMSRVASSLIKMAIAIGILSLSVKLLSGIDMDSLAVGLVGVGAMLAMLVATAAGMSRFSGNSNKAAKGMITFAIAIGILSLSVKALSKLNVDELTRGLVGVGVLLAEVAAFSRLVDNNTLTVKSATSVLVLSVALRVLASSVKYFAAMDWTDLAKGLASVGVLLLEIGIFSKLLGGSSFSIKAAVTILTLVAAVKMLEGTVTVFAGLKGLERGLVGVAGLLAAVAIFAAAVGHSSLTVSAAVSVVILANTIKMLSDVVKSLGGMTWSEMATGMVGLAGSVGVLVAALMLLSMGSSSMLVGAAALTVVAVALRIFVPVLERLAAMEIGDIVKGFVTLGVALVALGAGSVVLSALAPSIFLAAGAITVFGAACAIFGAGIALASAGIVAFAAALTASAAAIVASAGVISTGIISLITSIVVGIAEGLVQAAVTILNGISEILTALGGAIHAIGDFIVGNIPYVLSVVGTLVLSVLELIPTFIPQLVGVVVQFVVALIQTIVTWLPVIASALVTGVVTLINSIANGIRDNAQPILSAIGNILSAIIELVLTALADIVRLIPGVGDMFADEIEGAKDVVREKLAPDSFKEMTSDAMAGAVEGVSDGGQDLVDAAGQTGTETVDALLASFINGDASGSAEELVSTLVPGLETGVPLTDEQAQQMVDQFNATIGDGDASGVSEAFGLTAVDGLGSVASLFTKEGKLDVNAFKTPIKLGDASSDGAHLARTGADGASSQNSEYSTAANGGVGSYNDTLGKSSAFSSGKSLPKTGAKGADSDAWRLGNAGSGAGRAYNKSLGDSSAYSGGQKLPQSGAKGADADGWRLGNAGSGAGRAYNKSLGDSSAYSGGQKLPQSGAKGADADAWRLGSAGSGGASAYNKSLGQGSAYSGGQGLPRSAAQGANDDTWRLGDAGSGGASAYNNSLRQGSSYSDGQGLPRTAAQGANDDAWRLEGSGLNGMLGYVKGMMSNYAYNQAYSAGVSLVNASKAGIEWRAQIASPSKLTARLGNFVSQGFANGISALSGTVYKESVGVSQKAIDGLSGSIGVMSKYLNDDLDYEPTITPVMDLSEVQNGISQLNRMVDTGVAQSFIGAGIDAYPQMVLSSIGGVQGVGGFGAAVPSVEENVYNIYIDGDLLATDDRLKGAFDSFMLELARKADM